MQIKDKISKVDIYLIPIIFGIFVICLIGAFLEHAWYFRGTLVRTFAVPAPKQLITVDRTTLAEVARAVNINEKNLHLLDNAVQADNAATAEQQTTIPTIPATPKLENSTTSTAIVATPTAPSLELQKPSR